MAPSGTHARPKHLSFGGNEMASFITRALIGAAGLAWLAAPAAAQSTLKIAYVDPLSGGMAATGDAGLKTFQYLAEEINAKGGVLGMKIEIVGYDNKLNPQESLVQVQKA